jgi:hypothetical protein
METFTFSNIATTSLGFTLVTVKAAVEYLKSDQFLPLNSMDFKLAEKETQSANVFVQSPAPLSTISKDHSTSTVTSASEQNTERTNFSNTINLQNDVVFSSRIFQPPPEVIRLNPEEELGDFLSRLREDQSESTSKLNFRP